jgi:hypothetical protein
MPSICEQVMSFAGSTFRGIGVSVMVLQGMEDDALRIGAGDVPGNPCPATVFKPPDFL